MGRNHKLVFTNEDNICLKLPGNNIFKIIVLFLNFKSKLYCNKGYNFFYKIFKLTYMIYILAELKRKYDEEDNIG